MLSILVNIDRPMNFSWGFPLAQDETAVHQVKVSKQKSKNTMFKTRSREAIKNW